MLDSELRPREHDMNMNDLKPISSAGLNGLTTGRHVTGGRKTNDCGHTCDRMTCTRPTFSCVVDGFPLVTHHHSTGYFENVRRITVRMMQGVLVP